MTELRKTQKAAQEEHRRRWAERHPEKARAERKLRKRRACDIADFRHKVNGTIETHAHASRTRQGVLARLYMSGSIDADQLAASVEIAAVHERITREVRVGTVSLETRVDSTPRYDGAFFEALGAVRAEVAYSAWRRTIEAPALVLAIVIEDLGLRAAERRFGARSGRAKALICAALNEWSACMGAAIHDIDRADVLRSQARIL